MFVQLEHTRSAVTVHTALRYFPVAHGTDPQDVHDAWPPLEVKSTPAVHDLHTDCPCRSWYCPATQSAQAAEVLAPTAEEALPAPHWVQEVPE
jgi:hypothetical protein